MAIVLYSEYGTYSKLKNLNLVFKKQMYRVKNLKHKTLTAIINPLLKDWSLVRVQPQTSVWVAQLVEQYKRVLALKYKLRLIQQS